MSSTVFSISKQAQLSIQYCLDYLTYFFSRKKLNVSSVKHFRTAVCCYLGRFLYIVTFIHVFNHSIYLSGNIEKNTGPAHKSNFKQCFSIGHLNLNSILSHNIFQNLSSNFMSLYIQY